MRILKKILLLLGNQKGFFRIWHHGANTIAGETIPGFTGLGHGPLGHGPLGH
jgi:hypothetical protein